MGGANPPVDGENKDGAWLPERQENLAEFLTAVVESLSAGLFLVDKQGQLLVLNTWLADRLGLRRENWPGKPYQDLISRLVDLAVEPDVVLRELRGAILQLGEHAMVELALEIEDLRHLEITLFTIRDPQGMPKGWGGLVQDVTDLQNQVAWRLELLSVLAHDVRAPLATMKGQATALLANYQHWGSEMVLEFLQAIDRGVDRLIHQVERDLALTQVESGRLGLRPQAVEPERLVKQALERAAGVLLDSELQLDIPTGLPRVRADPARAEEVLVNLLENAARFNSPAVPLIIRVRAAGEWLQISVIDQGPGVPPENRQKIFEKYTRDEAENGGSGLGLYISRKIVEAHGGHIWVESPPPGAGRGAAFTFQLPIIPPQVLETASRQQPAWDQLPDDSFRVLVVEDNPDDQMLMRAILSEAHYQLEFAQDGPSALDLIRVAPPDLVVLDWLLPGMDGLSICRYIRRQSNIPILMVTSRNAQADLIAAFDAGVDDYMVKPFLKDELLVRTRALLRRGVHKPAVQAAELERFFEDGLLIEFDTQQAWINGNKCSLTPSEYSLLAYMVRHPRQVLTYEQLIDHLWGARSRGTRHSLFVHISRLRKKIEQDEAHPHFIVTRWGIGYVFLPG